MEKPKADLLEAAERSVAWSEGDGEQDFPTDLWNDLRLGVAAEKEYREAVKELESWVEHSVKYFDTFNCVANCDPAVNFHQPECGMRTEFKKALARLREVTP